MTAATMPMPAFVPPMFRMEEKTPEQVFLEVLGEFGYDAGEAIYTWEYGTNLHRLARLKTYVGQAGWRREGTGKDTRLVPEGSYHCARRVSVRMAARVALGETLPPRFRVQTHGWRFEMTGGEREQHLSYRGL